MYVEFHPDADQEFTEQALFYEGKVPGLGHRFIDEIESGLELLVSQPLIGEHLDEEFRCFIPDDFPFLLIYRIEPERIWIVAVAHQSRLPGYWRERINR
jgi:plasmid stabilization system protein ParE